MDKKLIMDENWNADGIEANTSILLTQRWRPEDPLVKTVQTMSQPCYPCQRHKRDPSDLGS